MKSTSNYKWKNILTNIKSNESIYYKTVKLDVDIIRQFIFKFGFTIVPITTRRKRNRISETKKRDN